MLKKLTIIFVITLLLCVTSGYFLVNYHLNKSLNPLYSQPSQFLVVESGLSFTAFTQKLVEDRWIDNNFWLKVYTRLNSDHSKIKVGTYLIAPNTSVIQLLKQIVAGKEHQFKITFIEGSTFKDWLQILSLHPQVSQQLSKSLLVDTLLELNIHNKNPEGLFFPDTYAFVSGTADIEILRRAYQKMQTELNAAWHKRALNLPYNSAYQALIMASIIEKESGQVAEQEIISSVFINRLNKKMRLQTDPTVIYGLGERYQGDIKRSHLREKTPYNTYRINGLPPTPIAMPGKLAINAALNPAYTDYYYFVSNGKGQHVFSQTLAEHNQAVTRYLQEMRKQLTNK